MYWLEHYFNVVVNIPFHCLGLCPPNSYSLNGLSPCDQCPKKTYQPQYGETSCIVCTKEEDDPACVDGNDKYNIL